MSSPESVNYLKSNRLFSLNKKRAFSDVFLPALTGGQKLDLDQARALLEGFNHRYCPPKQDKIRLADVFFASLTTSLPQVTNDHVLALAFLTLDDLKQTVKNEKEDIALIMEAEIAFIEGFTPLLMPEVEVKIPEGASVRKPREN